MAKIKKGAMLKQAPKTTLEKISSTKLKDVPEKAKNLAKKLIESGKDAVSNTINTVKNTTVGEATKAIGTGLTGYDPDRKPTKKPNSILAAMAKKNGGSVKKKMKTGGPIKKAQGGDLIKKGAKAVKSINKLMPSGLKKAQVGTLLRKVAKGTVAGAAAGAAASSTTGCSSGRRHCFHRRSYSTPSNRVPWGNRKNGGPIAKMKNGGSIKNVSAGPSKKTSIAPKVDPKGAYTKVQQRTLGNMKSGGKIKKNKTC